MVSEVVTVTCQCKPLPVHASPKGEFGKNSYVCNCRDDVHPGVAIDVTMVSHVMFLVAGVKAQVQICPGFLHSELGLARAHPWQCGVLRFAAGVPWEHRGHVGDEIHLRGAPGDGVISSWAWETLGKHRYSADAVPRTDRFTFGQTWWKCSAHFVMCR